MKRVRNTYKLMRTIAVSVFGATVLLLGTIMIVAPGPAIVFIPAGLAILGLEFAWARSWLKRLRQRISLSNSQRRAGRSDNHRARHAGL